MVGCWLVGLFGSWLLGGWVVRWLVVGVLGC